MLEVEPSNRPALTTLAETAEQVVLHEHAIGKLPALTP